jgi:hypothetical protein
MEERRQTFLDRREKDGKDWESAKAFRNQYNDDFLSCSVPYFITRKKQ